VVHRDLKPANVLLTADGTPKVTDFGLAKLLDDPQRRTRTGAVLGTPSYMAPEQAGGVTKSVSPAADVYALGAILYELLTGRPPFRGETPFDTLTQVLTEEPVPPARLNPRVPRDLETICLKCLQKTPRARYASALELAKDLRRFQADEPIHARPVGRLQRAYRWCRRNPRSALLLTTVVGLLLAFLVGSAVALVLINGARDEAEREKIAAINERNRADRNADDARKAERDALESAAVTRKHYALALDTIHDMIFPAQDLLDNKTGTLRLREKLLRIALKRLDDTTHRGGKDLKADLSLVVAYERLGDLCLLMAKDTDARKYYGLALGQAEGLRAAGESGLDARRALANVYDKFGQLELRARQLGEAAKHFQKTLGEREELHRLAPDDDVLRRDLAVSYNKLGNERLTSGQAADAKAFFDKSLRTLLGQKTGRGGTAFLRDLAFTYGRLGAASALLRDRKAARHYYLVGLETVQQLSALDTDNALWQTDVSAAYQRLCSLAVQFADYAEAQEWGDKARQAYERLVQQDPNNLDAKRWLAVTHQWIGDARFGADLIDDARISYRTTLATYEALAENDRNAVQLCFDLLIVFDKLATLEGAAGKYAEAVAWCDRFDETCRGLAAEGKLAEFHKEWRKTTAGSRAVYTAAAQGTDDMAAILKHPPLVAGGVLRLRAWELSRHGRLDEIPATAEALRRLGPNNALALGAVAHCYCFGVRTATDDKHRKRFADAALAALRETIRIDPTVAARLYDDPVLVPLRESPEFAALARGR
jgi:tetratricopeptide (TPR) repeat protein